MFHGSHPLITGTATNAGRLCIFAATYSVASGGGTGSLCRDNILDGCHCLLRHLDEDIAALSFFSRRLADHLEQNTP